MKEQVADMQEQSKEDVFLLEILYKSKILLVKKWVL